MVVFDASKLPPDGRSYQFTVSPGLTNTTSVGKLSPAQISIFPLLAGGSIFGQVQFGAFTV